MLTKGSPCGGMANVLDCDIIATDFKLQSSYYVHFWSFTFGKGMNPLIPPAMAWIVSPMKVDMPLNKETKLNQSYYIDKWSFRIFLN